MEGLIPALRGLQLAGKVELPAAEAAGVPSGWAQRLLCFAGTEAAAAPGRLREQQEAKAALGEEVVLVAA